MPNWCCNKIFIHGNYKNLKNLKNVLNFYISEESLDCKMGIFEKLVGVNPKINYDDELKSNIENWGTKWDVYELDEYKVNYFDTFIDFEIDTANSPPIEFCKKLSKKYNVFVSIKYYETGSVLGGQYILNNQGEITKKTSYSNNFESVYFFDKDNFWEQIEYILDIKDGDDVLEFVNPFKIFLDNSELLRLIDEIQKIRNR